MGRSSAPPDALLLTCEHGGNRVPARYARRFAGARRALAGHCGWDPGALWLARRLARRLGAPLVATTTTRLLVDCNRSLHHPRVFSSWSRPRGAAEREALVQRYYLPHRLAVERHVAAVASRGGRLLHVAVHSFTPRLHGRPRGTDVGLLYDPGRRTERALCARWQALLRDARPRLRIRRNHPYRGDADGLTRALRGRYGAERYRGIELEVSQRHLATGAPGRLPLARALEETLRRLLER